MQPGIPERKNRGGRPALMKDYMENVVETMINERFAEMMQKADPPFVAAQASDGDFMIAKTKGAFTVAALVKEGEIDKALDALVTETERVKRYGFTASEYDRARINVLKQYESLFNDRDKQKNRSYTNEYVRHFTDGGYIPGIETEYQLISQIAPQIPIEQVNQYAQSLIGDKNIVIGLTGPDKADIKYPTEAQLLEDFIKAQQLPVKPYEETVSNEPLIPELPAPGKIREMKTDPLFGATVLTLDNGIKVVLKHTDFKKDEILMTATSPGGSTLFGAKDIDNLKVFNDVITLGGAGNFSATDLNKVLPAGVFLVVAWAATYYVLTESTNSTVPALDAFTNALSFVGLWALARKYVEQWAFWIVVDVICCYLYIVKGIPFKAGLYGLYVVIAVMGYFKWKAMVTTTNGSKR